MAKVECTAGRPVETQVMGETYQFSRDRHGRYVADVHIDTHVEILTAVVHYRVVEDDPTAAPAAPVPAPKPAKQPRTPRVAKASPKDPGQPAQGADTGDASDKSGTDTGAATDSRPENGAKDGAGPDSLDASLQIGLGDGGAGDDDDGDAIQDDDGSNEGDDGDEDNTDDAGGDNATPSLLDIDGIGPAVLKKLEAVGITSLAQVAALTDEDIAKLDVDLKLKGSITRNDWVEQAKALMPDSE